MKTAKSKKSKFRVLWIVLLSIAGVLALAIAAGIVFTAPGRSELQNIVFASVDFSRLQDGVYSGEYRGAKDSFRDTAVEVAIGGGAVTDIRVTEGALAGEKQSNEIRKGRTINDLFNDAVRSESLKVDAISGATLTCNAHLKALEDALLKAQGG